MSQLCYPYGEGITCVCDGVGRIYKCFPELQTDQKHAQKSAAKLDDSLAHTNFNKSPPFLDGSTEIVLASTFLLLVILVFFGFVLYRCEKTILKKRNKNHKCCASHASLSYISVSIQTDSPVSMNHQNQLNHSHTIPRISNGSAKTGLTSLYSLSRNGSLTAGYLLPPPQPKHGEHELLMNQELHEQHNQSLSYNHNLVICHSPEEVEDLTESDTGLHSEGGLCDKY